VFLLEVLPQTTPRAERTRFDRRLRQAQPPRRFRARQPLQLAKKHHRTQVLPKMEKRIGQGRADFIFGQGLFRVRPLINYIQGPRVNVTVFDLGT
jgi:hypothetical protein